MNINKIRESALINELEKIAIGTPTIATGRKALSGLLGPAISGKSNVARIPFKRPSGVSAGFFGGSYNGTVKKVGQPRLS